MYIIYDIYYIVLHFTNETVLNYQSIINQN